jgi:N-methylhydantoinase A
LLLGRLNADFFLGGEIGLDLEASRNAMMVRCGQPLGLDPVQAASGIVEIANAHMMAAIRLISVQRGYDPRDFVLVAFGGGGPLHANALARELAIPTILIPPSPGIASALGLLMTDLTHEFVATHRQLLGQLEAAALVGLFGDYETQGDRLLAREGVAPAQRRLVRTLDLRYRGQSHELTVTVPAGALSAPDVERILEQFHQAHARAYGYAAREDAVELVNVRLTAIGVSPKARFKDLSKGSGDCHAAMKGHRAVWFSEAPGFTDCPIVDRYHLHWDDVVPGPAVIEEFDSTTVVHPGYEALVDQHGNLLLRRR